MLQCNDYVEMNRDHFYAYQKTFPRCKFPDTTFDLLIVKCVILPYLDFGAGKPVFGVSELQRRRQACASAQSGQRLSHSLIGKHRINTYYKRNSNVLHSLCC